MEPRGCYKCGDPGHMKRTFPKCWGKAVQQDHQPMIAGPAPRGEGQVGRGCPRGIGQVGGGQPATVQSGGGQSAGAPARFYAFAARPDATVLFDPGSTYSYVSSMFAHFLDIPREYLGTPIYLSTLAGDSMVMDRIYRSCVVTFYGYETRADLLLLDMIDFELILGMEWLSPYHSILDCHAKTVTLAIPDLLRLEWKGSSGAANEVSIGDDVVVQLHGCLCVPNVDGLRERILEEALSSRYSINPGYTKMYCDLRQHYWWRRMNKDIVE
ncbi:uncharacterized protein [Nicotiana sylvestris]|uniref:uncharacterized protein n=1 Tax=Nicotiana sylvestris TaxID=4096 RepID=UPI00388CD4C2